MALSAGRMARMSRLLDEALPLDERRRREWLEALSPEDRDLEDVLRRSLLSEPEGADPLATLPKVTGGNWPTPPSSGLKPGERVGTYQLLRELGSGGMAEVWLARRADGTFKREVALKLPMLSGLRKDLASRFARERDILAGLEHPNIARLYDAGVSAEGLPYLAMEYVDGQPLTAWCDAHRLGIRERLKLFLQMVDAVQYAHSHQVIHRDIKPSNILVTEAGQVRLLDFGVAKLLAHDGQQTELTQLYGRALTPDYASPELLRGDPIDAAADVYSLGVVLYELLSGSRPYRLKPSGSPGVLEQAIATARVEPPSTQLGPDAGEARATSQDKLARRLRGDLDAIVLKALAKRREARYESAAALADDLQRYLSGEPVEARPDHLTYRLTKFVLRHRAGAAASAAVALFAIAAIGYELDRLAATRQIAASSAAPLAPTGTIAGLYEKSIAVLPFVDMSEGHDQEYFSDGLSEELIALLAKVPDLRVPARTSSFYFKGKSEHVDSIAQRLRVAHVLEGSIRKAGDRLRVTAQLIRADNGYHLWSQTYDRNLKDVFEVQDEIAAAVVAALKAHLLPSERAANPFRTHSSEAHDHYLLGMLSWNRGDQDDYQRAEKEFRQAIALDPDYAMAYAGLASAEFMLADYLGDPAMMRNALALADRAIALAPDLSEAYATRGGIRTFFLWDWPGSQVDFERALSLDAGSAWTQQWYAWLLVAKGQLLEAVTAARKTAEVEPLSSDSWQGLGVFALWSGDLGAARQSLRRALELAPESDRAHLYLGLTEALDGHGPVALDLLRPIRFNGSRLFGIALAQRALGNNQESQEALQSLIAGNAQGYAYQIAEVYAFSGEIDKAFEWLDRAYSQHDGGMVGLRFDPFLNNLRIDPRFRAMLIKMKMVD